MRLIVFSKSVQLSAALNKSLYNSGFSVDSVDSDQQLDHALEMNEYALVLRVHSDGFESDNHKIIGFRKQHKLIPLVVVKKFIDTSEQARFLNLGVDDCVQIPINEDELLARVHAVLRRVRGVRQSSIEHHGIKLNTITKQVFLYGDKVELTRKEYCLLKYLMDNIGHPTERSRLEDALYSWSEEIESNTLVVHVYRLRKKFGNELIKTVRGFGYMIDQ